MSNEENYIIIHTAGRSDVWDFKCESNGEIVRICYRKPGEFEFKVVRKMSFEQYQDRGRNPTIAEYKTWSEEFID